jgi:hypothetical protein
LAFPGAICEVIATPQVRACLGRPQWHFRVNEVLDFGINFLGRTRKRTSFVAVRHSPVAMPHDL